MSNEDTEPHQAGDGADLTVTEARAGERRGLSKILVTSTLLGVVALAAVWLVVPHHAPAPSASAPAAKSVAPAG
jgi:hypothetical protein